MQVLMLVHIGGTRDGREWPEAGGVIEVPDHEGADLIRAGYAKAATDEDAPDPSDTGASEGDEAPASDSDETDATEPVVEPVAKDKPAKPRGTVKKAAPRG